MEKSTPHYDLAVVKAEVLRLGNKAFTMSTQQGARRMSLSTARMLQIMASLEYRMLHKSMTTYADHRIWQDVYHTTFQDREIYIKVTYRPGGGHPVVSFKEKDQ
ncbi:MULTISPECIES: type II toxin-antitoxin system MqsR family toxin [unclassified Pseudomonas]|uniref:type II toxin-antitoxin system MqsR family toxin n=1 Tax=unclassified Pseudomonas TaxID=196821 RepID=UPI001661180A|nr:MULTISPECIES: type II toxin-antitoxin system MqsR family toxin [unclassified Pseudomonas]MBD0702022.1 motility quorum-sensing regulator MqsR [Pseudomonas sp. PSB1]MDR8384740.1 type II toxin-antitoxin system MqsR family toxin [Pseudomonas sp. JL2]WNZ77521.1 type II toxin-antitoxin system MqsR family toxin [Pseudomonas sp. P105]